MEIFEKPTGNRFQKILPDASCLMPLAFMKLYLDIMPILKNIISLQPIFETI
jgi:hypothetical protein